MMHRTSIVLMMLALAILLAAKRDYPYAGQQGRYVYGQGQLWFDQVLDHFDYSGSTLWKQRYWVVDSYFNPKIGPVFLFICGYYVCQGVPEARQWVVTLAQRLQGLILVLEHRFYGYSLPFGNQSLSLNNMRLLNSEQALKDLAYFTSYIVSHKTHGVLNNPWISIGGSYPGALSAWYRLKYPHLTIGAIASSAVILAIENFDLFDFQMYLSANLSGKACVNAINMSSTKVETILNSQDRDNFKSQFSGADKLTDDEFLFFWVDSIVGEIQYGRRSKLCDSLKDKTEDQQFAMFVQLAKGNFADDYGAYYLSNDSYAIQNGRGARAWIFQSCTEYGFWQTYYVKQPMRSKRLDISFYRKFCADSFGEGVWPKVSRKNNEYGGLSIHATNLLMANGVEDPWIWASLKYPYGQAIARVANCPNCAHCVDLYTPSSSDSDLLKQIRSEQFLYLESWIESYWRTKNGKKVEYIRNSFWYNVQSVHKRRLSDNENQLIHALKEY